MPMGLRVDHFHHFDPVKIDVVHHHTDAAEDPRLDQILTELQQIKGDLSTIMDKEQQELDALALVDAATNKIGTNLSVVSDVVGAQGTVISTIGTEMTALVAALKAAGVSQTIIDQTTSIGTKLTAVGTTSDTVVAALQAQIPVLQAIAAQGASNAVPVDPPPPPPPPPLPTA